MVLTIGERAPRPSSPSPTTTAPTPAAPTTPNPTAERSDDLILTPTFAQWAEVYNVPQDLLEAIAWKASTWTPAAVGLGRSTRHHAAQPRHRRPDRGWTPRSRDGPTRPERRHPDGALGSCATSSTAPTPSERRPPPGSRGSAACRPTESATPAAGTWTQSRKSAASGAEAGMIPLLIATNRSSTLR